VQNNDHPRRTIVGVDGSEESFAALRWALHEASGAGGEVQAVLAYDTGRTWMDVGSPYESLIAECVEERAKETLDRVLAKVAREAPTVVVEPVVTEGHAAQVLVDLGRDADLLVVGTRGRGGFAGLLLGSVSQRCAERAPCPVVVVPLSLKEPRRAT
jgi:nucleotide-binding universal stress UspA family protein